MIMLYARNMIAFSFLTFCKSRVFQYNSFFFLAVVFDRLYV